MEEPHKYKFGEWVKVQNEKYGQVIDLSKNAFLIDINGIWERYPASDIKPDDRV